jgi:cytochrome c oxidase subunit 2
VSKLFNVVLLFSITILFIGCNSQNNRNNGDGTAWGVGSFNSNGKRIYFTSTSERGSAITYTGGPSMGMMMMGGMLACVSCHGTDARGGRNMMQTQTMRAPDIRWSSLASDHHEEHAEMGKHEDQKPYSFEDFRNAIEGGKHPDGDDLKKSMPRWKMSDEDLKDLMDYLKSLQ